MYKRQDFALGVVAEVDGIVTVAPARGEDGQVAVGVRHLSLIHIYIYTREENIGFDRRFLMKRVGEGWRIDGLQERLNGWQRTEL